MYIGVCMYVCAPHACSGPGGQKRASDPQSLELQMVVNCHSVLGFEPGTSG